MTTWILAAVLLGLGAGLGYRQGAIRVLFTMVGIITAALLASAIGHLLTPLLKLVIKNVVVQGPVSLVLGFILVLAIFKVVGAQMHKTVEAHYREAGDFKRKLWERLNMRLGLCLGLVNGLFYLVLVSTAIYMGSYWSVQIAPPETDMKAARVLNMLGRDLQSNGMTKVAESVNRMPASYYEAADVAGLVYANPELSDRLSRYPAFVTMEQLPELRALANDTSFKDLVQKRAPLADIMKHQRMQEILQNPKVVNAIRDAVEPNLADLRVYLEKGESAQFSGEPILGRWVFDIRGTIAECRRDKPNLPSSEIAKVRQWLSSRFEKAAVLAGPDQRMYLADFPKPNAMELETLGGQWTHTGGDYVFTLDNAEPQKLQIASAHMSLRWESMVLCFVKEE